jgi:hypothetical protein
VVSGFGHSVGISNDAAIVGSVRDGDSSGSAYLFDVATGTQLAKLTASDSAANDEFGWSVGISGDTAIIGAPSDDDFGNSSGSAYLFDVTAGAQLAKLTASDGAAHDNFGWSVGISGNTAIVGAPFDRDNGEQAGSAYLFDITTGAELAKLTPSDGAALDIFGWSVGISGDTAIVGAAYGDGEHSRSGSAYLFDVRSGTQLVKLTASDGASGDGFGQTVDISGNRAIVGAPAANGESGSAYLFDVTTGTPLAKLLPNGPMRGFGESVGISGDTATVGAFNRSIEYPLGSLHVFSATTGIQLAEWPPFDAVVGGSVDISGKSAIVGEVGLGSAYVLDVTTIVPEPATLALASLGAVVAVRLRRTLKRCGVSL